MAAVTLTEFRKNIFKMVDRLIETGEPLYLMRRGRPIVLELVKPAGRTLQQEYEAYMALGVREDASDFDAGDPADTSHWEWNPDPKLSR
jgi:antitoxin (DNA-binding transcriptional repressor) of toxin-antitoxin stability system